MASIDYDTSPSPTDGPWSRSAREHSPKFPRRKRSFNGDNNDNDNIIDYDSIPGIESSSSDDHYLYRRRLGLEQQGHDTTSAIPVVLRKAERRASTGTRPIVRPQMESERAFFGYTEKKARRVSIGGPRPCMEATYGSIQTNMDGTIHQQRRVSLGGTTTARPERANSWLGDEAAFDEPILRPYRQLSSENLCDDMCIGEETDEDLSIRTFRTADNNNSFSNRSNRSFLPDFSNRSNRSSFVPSAPLAFNNQNNHSCLPDFSNRSNRSCIRTTATATPTADLTSKKNPVSDFLAEQKSSPVLEEDETNTNNDVLVLPLEQNPITRTSQKNDKPKRHSISKSNTWPTNLRTLLSIRRLTLRNLKTTDVTTTSTSTTTTDRNQKAPQPRKGKSHSPYRKNKILRILRRASEVLEE